MKTLIVASVVLLACVSGSAMAACSGTALTADQLTTLLNGNMVCGSAGTDRWQEEHRPGGDLWDYKKGPGDPVDPEEKVGTWSVSGSTGHAAGLVNYTYNGGSSFSYTVYDNGGGAYSFCGTGTTVEATEKGGIVGPCP